MLTKAELNFDDKQNHNIMKTYYNFKKLFPIYILKFLFIHAKAMLSFSSVITPFQKSF